MKFKSDKFKKARGGYSRLFDIRCEKCGNHICYYQKDGPGILKRMYLDRVKTVSLTRAWFVLSVNDFSVLNIFMKKRKDLI